MANKTILHFTAANSTKYGSFEKFLIELSKSCYRQGYNTVLQYEKLPRSQEYLTDLKNNNVKVIVKPILTNPLCSIITITKIIKEVSPEIVQTHYIGEFNLLICPIITKILDIQKIFHMQHLFYDYKKIPLIKFLFNRYSHIFCVSHAVANNFLKIGVNPAKISVNYLGLFGVTERSEIIREQLRKKFDIPNDTTVLSCIAWDHPIKGVDILLKALKKVLVNYPRIHLVLIGIEPSQSTLYKLSENLELTKFVHWIGIRDHAIQMLNIADIYIQPSYREGLGLGIIEAMALRLPIIATNIGGIPEAVIDGETGFLVKPGSVNGLADAIKQLMFDKERLKIFGENGHRRYQELFKGEAAIKHLLKVYDIL